MPFKFEVSTEFIDSVSDIDTLLNYAIKERDSENEKNRKLFLKLAIVSSVTKFQIFIENILKEFHFKVTNSEKKNDEINVNLRLNSLKIYLSEKLLHKKLENFEAYSEDKLEEIKSIATQVSIFCEKSSKIDQEFRFETKYPLGKTGLEELIKLFRQINGENIFENPPFDVNKLNEILGRRHAIIHEDSNPQITEETVTEYKIYLLSIIEYIDSYLGDNL